MDKIVSATAVGANISRLYGDSTDTVSASTLTGEMQNRVNLLKRDFVKLHVITAAGGPIMTFEIMYMTRLYFAK